MIDFDFFNDSEEEFFNTDDIFENLINEIQRFHFDNQINYEQDIDDIDYEDIGQVSEPQVYLVPPNHLPHGDSWKALGIYVPQTHTILIADNLSPKLEKFVYYHEIAHSLGIMDERKADEFAKKKCGYNIDLGNKPRYFKYYY
ncbi:MAG: hypothetical protein Q8N99_01890 [Nanoarchaeota archaeon]|nr:hypothetical protein [Nanoarchaeota archaeon]